MLEKVAPARRMGKPQGGVVPGGNIVDMIMTSPDNLVQRIASAGPSRQWQQVQAEAAGYADARSPADEAPDAPSALDADGLWRSWAR